MSESFRATYSQDANGEAVQTGTSHERNNAAAKAAETPAQPVHRTGGQVVRVTVSEDGSTELSRSTSAGAKVNTDPSKTEASAMSAAGIRVPLWQAKATDVVDLPGLGTSSAAAYVQMGYLRPLRDGGYEITGAVPQVNPKSPDAKPDAPPVSNPQAKPDAPTVNLQDAAGIPRTPADVDTFQATLVQKTPMAFEGALTAIVKGAEVDWKAIAEQHHAEDPKQFQAQGEKMHEAYLASGRAALSNVGVVNHQEFETWARGQGDAADTAVRDLVSNKSVGKLQELGRQFVAQSNQRLASMLEAQGADVKIENGKVYIARKSLGLSEIPARGDFGADRWLSFDAARAAGHIEVE